jgi:hypothetical protein
LVEYHDNQTEEEQAAEDEAAFRLKGHTTMVVPTELVLPIAALIARHQAKSKKAPTNRRQRAASRVTKPRRP